MRKGGWGGAGSCCVSMGSERLSICGLIFASGQENQSGGKTRPPGANDKNRRVSKTGLLLTLCQTIITCYNQTTDDTDCTYDFYHELHEIHELNVK